jgi:phosphohistidine swiveling domain-containing protein
VSSPLHLPASGPVAWTRGNLGEALPGLCTPLSWTFFGPATEDGLRGGFHRIGALAGSELPVPADVGERFATAIYGWPSANIDMMARMAERLPGVDPAQVEQELFGEVRDVERRPTCRRYPAVAVRMPLALGTVLREVRANRAEGEVWWRRSLRELGDAGTGDEVAQRVLREARPRFTQLMLLHTIISMIASGLRDQVVALADGSGPGLSPARLVTGYGTVEETRVAEELWAVSRGEITVEAFVDRHGWHGINNGQIHARVWREDLDQVPTLAERYRAMSDAQRPSARGARQRAERERAERELLGPMGRLSGLRAQAVLGAARRFIAHREVGKAGYLIAVDGARAAARHLGRIWHSCGQLRDPEDIFLLTVDEVAAGPDSRWSELVEQRRALQIEYRSQTLPDAWVGVPEPISVADSIPASLGTGRTLHGIGVNGGVVVGRARLVVDPGGDFDAGEILVCATTDPSWVALFVAAEAVVTDIGGHLSHGAIVARELGIPCVVNTRDGTRRIRSGDTLRIDGHTGEVTILHSVENPVPA